MCGRFVCKSTMDELVEAFQIDEVSDDLPEPSYNIGPSGSVLAIIGNGKRKLGMLQWGLVPSWAKDPEIGHKMINARAETLTEKPSFRDAFKKRRCLIVANGFYEWRKDADEKVPMYIYLKSNRPFAFAGLYEMWHSPEGEKLSTCTIITTAPNSLMKPIHNRMPAIIPAYGYDHWLDRNVTDPEVLQALLAPYPAEEMAAYAVSRWVNSPRNNSEKCIAPAE
ncbi:MAG: SOS response-associated peptidase [Chlorobiales bacterium]|jgi:putative SOS response-associated peptidase YedK|nr:SOS response-associated peptidase [Chlorobiales bacterium]